MIRIIAPTGLAIALALLAACTCPSGRASDAVADAVADASADAIPGAIADVSARPVRSSVPEGINRRFLDPELDPEAWVNRWEVESREIFASRDAIVAASGLGAGATVADVGSGTGLFLVPFAQAVGDTGKVYALDISPNFVEHLRERTRSEGLENVSVVLSGEASTELAPESVDLVFVCDTYHHFEFHVAMLASIREALRPGGTLVIVDFERIPGVTREWILGHVRAGKAQVTREIEAAGFRRIDEVKVPGLHENYMVRFEKQ